MSKPKQMLIQVTGQPPLEAGAALFGNFLGLSRVGNQVQFEFIYVDLNALAAAMQQTRATNPDAEVVPAMTGMTVSKVVMPAESFVQTEPQFQKMFEDIKKELKQYEHPEHEEHYNDRQRASS